MDRKIRRIFVSCAAILSAVMLFGCTRQTLPQTGDNTSAGESTGASESTDDNTSTGENTDSSESTSDSTSTSAGENTDGNGYLALFGVIKGDISEVDVNTLPPSPAFAFKLTKEADISALYEKIDALELAEAQSEMKEGMCGLVYILTFTASDGTEKALYISDKLFFRFSGEEIWQKSQNSALLDEMYAAFENFRKN